MIRSFLQCFAALLMAASATAAAPAEILLPNRLLAAAHNTGNNVRTAEIVEDADSGLWDRGDGPRLRVSRAALEVAANPDERLALLAFLLSYRVGFVPPSKSGAARAGEFLAAMAAADIDESIAARDRSDPNLKVPTTIRLWQRQPASYAHSGTDPVALRGLAWAKSAGVCERTSIALLTRLESDRLIDTAIAADAGTMLRGLGLLRFSPDQHCRSSQPPYVSSGSIERD